MFTAESVAANPIVILADLSEIFPTHIGSSGHWERPDERLLTARRQIHGESVGAGPGRQKTHRETTLQGFAPLVQGLTEQAASGLITSGQAERQLDQRGLDMAYGDYLEQRNYPQEQLNFALGALQGVPYETRTIGLEQGQQYVQSPSIYGQTIGGLGSLASAYYLRNR